MKNKKRFLLILLIAPICMFLLNACGTANQKLDADNPDDIPTQSTPVATLPPESEPPSVEPSPLVEVVASGVCGENATWVLDSEGILTISGSGGIYGYMGYRTDSTSTCEDPSQLTPPWNENYDNQSIKAVIIEPGITSIGVGAFMLSSRYDMERGEQREPAETKKHTAKREWQIATQESKIDDLQTQKELLEFDGSALTSTRRYERKKAEQATQQRQDIENEINTLLEKQNQLQEYLDRNINIVKNWKNEVESKIKSINEVVDEYQGFSNEMEKQYSAEVRDYILKALGDVPDDAYEMVFNPPVTGFTSYSEEEHELEL